MAFLGGSWNDDRNEMDDNIGPFSHWLEDDDDFPHNPFSKWKKTQRKKKMKTGK